MKKLLQVAQLGLILILGVGAPVAFGQSDVENAACGGDVLVPKAKVIQVKKQRDAKITPKSSEASEPLYPAKVVKLQGRVFLIERDGHKTEQMIAVGSRLQLNDVIQTSEQSFISMRLGDGTLSMMPSSSRVKLLQSGRSVGRFELLNGEVQNRVIRSPKANKNTFEIQLPSSMIGVRGTEFSVRTMPENSAVGAVTVENGTVWVRSRTSCQAPLVLAAGQGALTSEASVLPLLSAPELVEVDKPQPTTTFHFVMQPVAGAVRYRALLVGDVSYIETVAEAYSDQPHVTMNAEHLPNGFYFVRLSAYNAAGVEGMSRKYLFLHNYKDVEH